MPLASANMRASVQACEGEIREGEHLLSQKSSLTGRQSLFAIHSRFTIRQSPIAIRYHFWLSRSLALP